MSRPIVPAVVALIATTAGIAIGYVLAEEGVFQRRLSAGETARKEVRVPSQPGQTVLYYRDPTGKPEYSPTPKKDDFGRDYLPVHENEEAALAPVGVLVPEPPKGGRILYYRNPMGLPDTSPAPKKDSMGMDYIPVYEDQSAGGGTVQVAPERVQVLGVRTDVVGRRDLVRQINAVGTVQFDERRTSVVSPKYEGWIEQLLVNSTGQAVHRDQPLMRVYSPDLLLAQQEYAAIRASLEAAGVAWSGGDTPKRLLDGALQRLRYLDFPEEDSGGTAARLRAAPDGNSARSQLRHRRREAGGAGHAIHAGRAALYNCGPVAGVADR